MMTSKQHGKGSLWLARIGALLLALLTAIYLLVVVTGVVSGNIAEVNKYGNAIVERTNHPIQFWLTVGYHTLVISFIAYFAYLCARAAGWIRKIERLEKTANSVGSALNPHSRASPLIISIVLGSFFIFLLFIVRKWG
jgi:hypothetical protein